MLRWSVEKRSVRALLPDDRLGVVAIIGAGEEFDLAKFAGRSVGTVRTHFVYGARVIQRRTEAPIGPTGVIATGVERDASQVEFERRVEV